MRFHRLVALLVVVYALAASLTSCAPFPPTPVSTRALTTEETQQVIREHNFDVLAVETIGDGTVILYDTGGRAGYYAGTMLSTGLITSTEAQGGGASVDIDVVGARPGFLCVALLEPTLAQQAATVEITFADGTSTQAPVHNGARGVIIPNERGAAWRMVRVYGATGHEVGQVTL
jgi:hypothetical protein